MKVYNSKSKMMVAVALLALGTPVTVCAQMRDMPMQEHREMHGVLVEMGHLEKMGDMMDMCVEHADKSGLSDAQVAQMRPVHREMQKKQARFKAEVKIAEIELMEIVEVRDFDLEKAGMAVKKIAGLKTAHHLEMLKAMKEVRGIWTDEQFSKMMKMMPKKADGKKHPKKLMKKP
jgi:Spy/CpxP family protein refolding chaperone